MGKVMPLSGSSATPFPFLVRYCEYMAVHSNGRPVRPKVGRSRDRPTFAHCLSASNRPCESLGPMSVRDAIANEHKILSPSCDRCHPPDFSPLQLDLVTNDQRDKHEQDSSKCPPDALSVAAQRSELSRYVVSKRFQAADRAAGAPDLTFTISANPSIESFRLTVKKSFNASR